MVTQILYFFIVLLTGSTSDGIEFLAQGTIWPDILESEEGIKAHHNAGGLPEDMNFELVEPVRILFKDEVRVVLHRPCNQYDGCYDLYR